MSPALAYQGIWQLVLDSLGNTGDGLYGTLKYNTQSHLNAWMATNFGAAGKAKGGLWLADNVCGEAHSTGRQSHALGRDRSTISLIAIAHLTLVILYDCVPRLCGADGGMDLARALGTTITSENEAACMAACSSATDTCE